MHRMTIRKEWNGVMSLFMTTCHDNKNYMSDESKQNKSWHLPIIHIVVNIQCINIRVCICVCGWNWTLIATCGEHPTQIYVMMHRMTNCKEWHDVMSLYMTTWHDIARDMLYIVMRLVMTWIASRGNTWHEGIHLCLVEPLRLGKNTAIKNTANPKHTKISLRSASMRSWRSHPFASTKVRPTENLTTKN